MKPYLLAVRCNRLGTCTAWAFETREAFDAALRCLQDTGDAFDVLYETSNGTEGDFVTDTYEFQGYVDECLAAIGEAEKQWHDGLTEKQRAAFENVLDALADWLRDAELSHPLTGDGIKEDDRQMAHAAPHELEAWADDLESRVIGNAGDHAERFRQALHAYTASLHGAKQ